VSNCREYIFGFLDWGLKIPSLNSQLTGLCLARVLREPKPREATTGFTGRRSRDQDNWKKMRKIAEVGQVDRRRERGSKTSSLGATESGPSGVE
jgi:hypothetical protein